MFTEKLSVFAFVRLPVFFLLVSCATQVFEIPNIFEKACYFCRKLAMS